MSIEIDWENLTTGPAGLDLADCIRDFIHDKFQQVQLPRFIRSVQVHKFDFGTEAPVVEIVGIEDPAGEFYEDDEDDEDEDAGSGGHGEGELEDDRDVGVRQRELGTDTGTERMPISSLRGSTNTNTAANAAAAKTSKPDYIDTHLPNLRSGFGNAGGFHDHHHHHQQQQHITTPFLSRSNTSGLNTPGIPGGTSNFSYFHLPLSGGLSGTQTPLSAVTPFAAGWHDSHEYYHHHHHQYHQRQQEEPITTPHLDPERANSNSDSNDGNDDRSQDLQISLHISYTGSLSLSLTAEILLDYPMPSFVGIPLKLQITGLSFEGVGLVAYLRRGDGRRKVHFCFLGGEDGEVVLGGGSAGDERVDSVEGYKEKGEGDGKGKLGGPLKEIRVESEIGRQEGGKQVLKNVGKVEKFVLEQVRRIFEDEFVWPSFWTFLL